MASISSMTGSIVVTPQLRHCWVNGRKALFHCWANRAQVAAPSPLKGGAPGGQLWEVYAIVEYEDGSIHGHFPYEIRFEPSSKFAEEAWGEKV